MTFPGEMTLKSLVKKYARRCGCEFLGPRNSYAAQRSLAGLLLQEQINLVLDVGANTGQFANWLRACGYRERIISFEPLASAHAQLCGKAEKYPNWTIADRTAVGAKKGPVEIHLSKNSQSSSILDMLPSHLEAAPESIYIGSETVPVNRLDDLCAFLPNDRVLLKIDVQGYERQVLEGASRVLSACLAVHTEMSLLPLYEGQILARELWDMLVAQGFEPWSLEPCFRNPATFRMLQLDGVFVRRGERS
jgi:FkbM family methyltransferase